jgi:hypothetical protein
MKFKLLGLMLLSGLGLLLIYGRVMSIWLDLRAYDFCSQELEAQELQAMGNPDVEIFYTKNTEFTAVRSKAVNYDPLRSAVTFIYNRRDWFRWVRS